MKVVVCGAGISGLALAHQLAAHGADVVLLEKAPGPRAQGYMIDFFGPGYDAAEAMGLLPAIREVAYEIEEASFVDESGRQRARMTFVQFAKVLHGRLFNVTRPDLERVLHEQLRAQVDVRFGTTVTAVEDRSDRVRVTSSGGDVLDADLLVGADGVHSTVRRLVFGPEPQFLRYLGFHTAAYLFRDPAIHAEVRNRFCMTDTVNRQMGLYGLRDGRIATYAVHRTPDPRLPHDVRAELHRVYGSLGWVVPRALGHCPAAAQVYYDQVAQIELPQWSRGRVALVGDACCAVSLLAGQGASLGIAGGYVLAEQLARHRSVRDGLHRYECMLRPVAEDKQRAGRRAARWFLPRSTRDLRLRRLTLRVSQVPGVDRCFAAALVGKPTALAGNVHAAARSPRSPRLEDQA